MVLGSSLPRRGANSDPVASDMKNAQPYVKPVNRVSHGVSESVREWVSGSETESTHIGTAIGLSSAALSAKSADYGTNRRGATDCTDDTDTKNTKRTQRARDS